MISPLEGSNPSPSATELRFDDRRLRRRRSPRWAPRRSARAVGRPMAPRMRPCGRARASARPRSRSVHARPTTSRSTSRSRRRRPASVLVVNVGHEPARGYWGEVLTTGAEARGHRRARDRRRCARRRRARSARLPGVLDDDRVARRDEAGAGRDRRHVRWSVTSRWRPATGSSATPTVSSSSRVAHLDDVLAAGRARAEKEQRMFDALRAGRTTVELLDLDPSPIDRA